MHAVVAQVAGAVIVEPAPAAVKAVFIEGAFFRGAEPHVVIDGVRGRAVRRVADVSLPGAFPGFGDEAATEGAAADVGEGGLQAFGRTVLRAQLHDAVVFFHGGDHPLAFDDVVSVRLFNVDIFAGLAGEDGGDGVPVIGSADHDGVEAVVVEQVTKIADDLWFLSLQSGDGVHGVAEAGGVDLGDGDDFGLGVFREVTVESSSATAGPDHADADAFAGGGFGNLIQGESGQPGG